MKQEKWKKWIHHLYKILKLYINNQTNGSNWCQIQSTYYPHTHTTHLQSENGNLNNSEKKKVFKNDIVNKQYTTKK